MRVAILGGGISGLTAAYRLRVLLGQSASITVIESGATLGGKLRTASLAGNDMDVGAEAFLARRPEATELAAEVGLSDQLVHPTGARPSVRAGAATVPVPRATFMGIPGSPEEVAGVLSTKGYAAVAVERSLPRIELPSEDVSLGTVLRQRFGDELVDRLVDPLLGGVYAGGADGLGLRAVLPGLAEAIDAGAGSVTEAAASLLPESSTEAPVFATLRGGLAVLVSRLAELSRAEIRSGAPACRLHATPTGWSVHVGDTDETIEVDAVVLAVPPPAARKLLSGPAPQASHAFAEMELSSMAVIGLAYPAETAVPDTSGVLIAAAEQRSDGAPFTAKAFTFSSRKWSHHAGRSVLIRGSVGRVGDQQDLRVTDEELVRSVRGDLGELTGTTGEPRDVAVARWGGGVPQYAPGHAERVRRIEQSVAELPGLEVAGAALHGVGIPACIATATGAASRVAGFLRGAREQTR